MVEDEPHNLLQHQLGTSETGVERDRERIAEFASTPAWYV